MSFWPKVTLPEITAPNGVFIDGDWVESKDQDPDGDVRLIQLADIGDGEFLDKSARFLTSSKAKELRCTLLQPNDILLARMPDPLGRCCVFPGANQPCVTVVDVCIIRPDPRYVDTQWLMWHINSLSFRRQINSFVNGTTRQRISRSNLAKIEFSLPPLDEQTRIAAIMDAAETLRVKRKKTIDRLEDLRLSTFLAMFTGEEANKWPRVSVSDLVAQHKGAMRTGPFGSQLLHSEFIDEGIAVLGIDNVVQNTFSWSQRRYISEEKYRQLKRYTVFPGDVLITIMGTCGRCAIVPEDVGTAINTKHLCCITLDPEKCLPVYLQAAFLLNPEVRRQLSDAGRGAIMEGLNMGIISSLAVPLPPVHVQLSWQRFAAEHSHHLYQLNYAHVVTERMITSCSASM